MDTPIPVAPALPVAARAEVAWGGRVERHAHLFWRIRIPLWVALAGSGAVLLGWGGLLLGSATALLVETAFSYRPPLPGQARPQAQPDGRR